MEPLLYSCPIRKTARNFNQPMCKAAKTTIVEVCLIKIVFSDASNIQSDRGIQRDRNVPLKHVHSVWLELTRGYVVHIFNTITTLQIYLGLAQRYYYLFCMTRITNLCFVDTSTVCVDFQASILTFPHLL